MASLQVYGPKQLFWVHFTHRSSANTPLALFVAGNRDALALVYILPGAEFQSLTFCTFVMMYMDHVLFDESAILYSPELATSMRQGQTNALWEKTPSSGFLLFSPLCMPRFVKTFSSPDFWGVKKAPCKKFHVFGENWQRNHFPKLTTFTPMLQLSHSESKNGLGENVKSGYSEKA